jgi:hypothetical protein
MHVVLYTHVYLWKEGKDVDGEKELYGEVLRRTYLRGLVKSIPGNDDGSCV